MTYIPSLEFIKHLEHESDSSTSRLFPITSRETYETFLKEFTDCIRENCWQLCLNEITLFNLYKEDTKNDIIVRDHLLECPYCLIDLILLRAEDSSLVLYMVGTTPWCIIMNYTAQTKTFTLTHDAYK